MQEIATQFAQEMEAFAREIGAMRVTPEVAPAEIRAHLESAYDFTAPRALAPLMQDVTRMLRDWTLHTTHPRYFGLFNPSVHEAGVWGDALAALFNPQVGAWAHAPAASEIERHVLLHFARMLGIGDDPDRLAAHFTSGGSEANQTAVIAALCDRCPRFVDEGAAGLEERPMIYVSSESHHSFVKIARGTGIGEHALRVIPADASLRMDVDALREQLRTDAAWGCQPVIVVATAGTTGAGVIDPLPEIADLCEAHGAWLHVDAAYGGSAAFSPSLAPYLAGIHRADSITWDAHKWLSVPMGAGMFFCRHPQALRAAFAVDASYVPTEGEEVEDLYLSSMQWSRRFIGLKVFFTLAALGDDGMRAQIEHQTAMGNALRTGLSEHGWEVVNDTPLPVVCFTHDRIRDGRVATGEIVSRVRASGRAWISDVVLGAPQAPRRVLRACITSHRTQRSDVDILLEELERAIETPSYDVAGMERGARAVK